MKKREESERRQILRLYKIGFYPLDIADELGLTRDKVNGILKREGVYKVKKALPISLIAYKKRSIRYWAELYGIPLNTYYEAARKHMNVGLKELSEVGSPRLLTEKEFLSIAF